MHQEPGQEMTHEMAMVPGSALAKNLVMLAAYIKELQVQSHLIHLNYCLLYTSPSPRDVEESRMPSSA